MVTIESLNSIGVGNAAGSYSVSSSRGRDKSEVHCRACDYVSRSWHPMGTSERAAP